MSLSSITGIALVLLQSYFQLMRMSGRTPEEADMFYSEQKALFEGKNKPENLPQV